MFCLFLWQLVQVLLWFKIRPSGTFFIIIIFHLYLIGVFKKCHVLQDIQISQYIFMLKNSTTSAPDTRKQPLRVWVKSYFFHKLLFGDIKLSDLECRNRKLSAHDCNDHIKRPFSFDNYHETQVRDVAQPRPQSWIYRYSIIPHTQHTYRISAKTTWQLWNVQLILIVAIVGVILNEDSLANTVVASRFQFLIIFS